VQEICQDLEAFKKYEGGLFVTYYLCPTDYHRVHAPTDMNIHQVTYAPGELWPVNQWSTHNVRNLFGINERVIIDFKAPQGLATLVLVGATNVGQMSLSFDSQIVTNVPLASGAEVTSSIRKSYAVNLQKGDHVGTFHMGSTVVMIYSKEFCQKAWPDITKNPFQTEWVQKFFNQPVQVGQAFQ
jgi:phosphatidylserine decarboxylase